MKRKTIVTAVLIAIVVAAVAVAVMVYWYQRFMA